MLGCSKLEGTYRCRKTHKRRTLRRARRLVSEAPRPELRVPPRAAPKGASTAGRIATHSARSNKIRRRRSVIRVHSGALNRR